MSLQNKTALITGAGAGIGRAIALLFAKEGANVVIADVSQKDGDAAAAMISEAGGQAVFLQGDVTDAQYHVALVKEAQARYGQLDIAVNNVGISEAPKPLAEISVASWDKVIAINLSGMFYGIRAQVPAMLAAGGGAIVNMSSIAGGVGLPGIGHYTASKHGVIGLTKSIAVEYGTQGIRANAVGPGYINTDLVNLYPPEERAKLAAVHAMNRLGDVHEVAELVLWLASPKASFVTGAYIPVDGGMLAK